jgi:excisionase family DNA binding protein
MVDRETGGRCLQENDAEGTTRGEAGLNESGQPISDIMTVAEAAAYLRCSVSSLYDLTRSRANARMKHPIPTIRLGTKSLRFRRSSLDAWLSELEKQAAG